MESSEKNMEWTKIPGKWDCDYYINKDGVVRYWWVGKCKSKYDAIDSHFRYPTMSHYKVGYGNGYYAYNLRIGGKPRISYIHRLLAITFIPNPENKPQVNHIDGNSLNNDISNLEWSTSKENIRHAWSIGLCTPHGIYGNTGSAVRKSVFEGREQRVLELRNNGLSQSAIGKIIGLDQSVISRILNNKTKNKTA